MRSLSLPRWLAVAVVIIGPEITPIGAVEPLRHVLSPVADDCAKWLKGHKHNDVVVGTISGPQTYPTSSGPGIRLTLGELLKERDITVKARAGIAITLSYKPKEIPDARNPKLVRLVVDLRVVFVDNREQDLEDFDARIEHEEAVRLILGINGDRQQNFTAIGDDQVARLFYEPKAHFDKETVLAGDRSPFGLEVLIDGKPVKPEDREGLAYAPVPRDQEYTIRLVNRSRLDMAVRLTIDGINMFSFYEERQPATLPDGKPNPRRGQPTPDLLLVPAEGEALVPGWIFSRKKAVGFKVTEYPRTAAALLARDNAPTGTITATFSAAWEKEAPKDEPPTQRGPGDDGTGFGQSKEIDGKVVQRNVGAVRASVSVRYALAKTK